MLDQRPAAGANRLCAGSVIEQAADRGSNCPCIAPVSPSVTTAPIPPAAVVTSGVPEASASITTLGRPSTFPLSSRTDGTTMTFAAAK